MIYDDHTFDIHANTFMRMSGLLVFPKRRTRGDFAHTIVRQFPHKINLSWQVKSIFGSRTTPWSIFCVLNMASHLAFCDNMINL